MLLLGLGGQVEGNLGIHSHARCGWSWGHVVLDVCRSVRDAKYGHSVDSGSLILSARTNAFLARVLVCFGLDARNRLSATDLEDVVPPASAGRR